MTQYNWDGGSATFDSNSQVVGSLGGMYTDNMKSTDVGMRWQGCGAVLMDKNRKLKVTNHSNILKHISEPLEIGENYGIKFVSYDDGMLIWIKRQNGELVEWTNSVNKTTVWLSRRKDEIVL